MTKAEAAGRRPRVVTGQAGAGRFLAMSDHTLPIVHFTLAWRHGAYGDPEGTEGALALLLPMLLRGTKALPRVAFHEALERLGATLETSVGFDLALFRGACLAEHLPATLELVQAALSEPALRPVDLDDLRAETIEGLRNEREDDDSLAEMFLRQQFYAGTRRARAPVGTAATLQGLRPADLVAAKRQLCAPWALFAAAGDVDAAQVQAAATEVFATLPPHAPPSPHTEGVPVAAARGGGHALLPPRILLVDKPERSQAQVRIALPGLPSTDPDNDALWLGTVAFGGTFTSPLTREVRDERGWSYVAQADYRQRSLTPSPIVLRTAPANRDAVACIALELELLGRLARGELALTEIERARAYLLGRAPFWSATAFDVLGPSLVLELLGLSPEALYDHRERLGAISGPSVLAALWRVTNGATPLVTVVGSADALLAPLEAHFGQKAISVVPFTDGL